MVSATKLILRGRQEKHQNINCSRLPSSHFEIWGIISWNGLQIIANNYTQVSIYSTPANASQLSLSCGHWGQVSRCQHGAPTKVYKLLLVPNCSSIHLRTKMKSALLLLLCLVPTMASPYWLDTSPMVKYLTTPEQKLVDQNSIVAQSVACNCEYHLGGCAIAYGSLPGYKCVCTFQGLWTCMG